MTHRTPDHDVARAAPRPVQKLTRRVPWKGLGIALVIPAVLTMSGGCRQPEAGPVIGITADTGPMTLSWSTPIGPGGARIPAERPPSPPGEDPPPAGISRLRGAVFPPDSDDVLFVGTAHDGEPIVTPDELLDAFVVALRALQSGTPPGVSIDPTDEQVSRGLAEGDAMPVRYDGDTEQTRVGEVMFEADRVMKALSSGRDNLTHAVVSSDVEGYHNRLEMHTLDEGGAYTPWTRFWIEQDSASVEIGAAGTAVLVTPKLKVEARSQVLQEIVDAAGRTIERKLVDSDDSVTAPSARRFAEHMTDNYDAPGAPLDFAREFDIYRELLVHATVVSLAEAVRPGGQAPVRVPVDLDWLEFDHVVEPVTTSPTTPATVARLETSRSVHMIRGGVDLHPLNRYREPDRPSQELIAAVRALYAEHPGLRPWKLEVHDTPYVVCPASISSPTSSIWQVDMCIGPIEVVRVSDRDGGGPLIGTHWSIRLPGVTLPSTRVTFESLGELAPYALVQGLDGREVRLNQVGQTQLPGQPATLSYSGVDPDGREHRLLMFTNEWIYIDGQLDFVSVNGGPVTWRLAPGASLLCFAAGAPHLIRRAETTAGTVEYDFGEDGSLEHLRAGSTRVDLEYDRAGDLIGLRSGKARITYRLAGDGFLDVVQDQADHRIRYLGDPATRQIAGMVADDLELPPGATSHPRFTLERTASD